MSQYQNFILLRTKALIIDVVSTATVNINLHEAAGYTDPTILEQLPLFLLDLTVNGYNQG